MSAATTVHSPFLPRPVACNRKQTGPRHFTLTATGTAPAH